MFQFFLYGLQDFLDGCVFGAGDLDVGVLIVEGESFGVDVV